MPKLRQNIVTGDWVVIAPERSKRPDDFVHEKKSKDSSKKDCPFCFGGAGYKEAISDAGTKHVYVIPNKYPAFTDCGARVISEGEDFYFSTPSRGAHEVIIPRSHGEQIFEMDEKTLSDLFHTYKKRLEIHSKNPEIEHSLIIHNSGVEAGMSIDHPHSQLLCSSVLPPYIKKELDGSKDYWLKKGGCVYCDILREEENFNNRIIYSNKYFTAFTFFASRFPFEIWIVPYSHHADFVDIEDVEIEALADIAKNVFQKLARKLNNPDYNFWIHQAPSNHNAHEYYHWHIEIAPRLAKMGGYELGAGIVVDIVSPESAAKFLTE